MHKITRAAAGATLALSVLAAGSIAAPAAYADSASSTAVSNQQALRDVLDKAASTLKVDALAATTTYNSYFELEMYLSGAELRLEGAKLNRSTAKSKLKKATTKAARTAAQAHLARAEKVVANATSALKSAKAKRDAAHTKVSSAEGKVKTSSNAYYIAAGNEAHGRGAKLTPRTSALVIKSLSGSGSIRVTSSAESLTLIGSAVDADVNYVKNLKAAESMYAGYKQEAAAAKKSLGKLKAKYDAAAKVVSTASAKKVSKAKLGALKNKRDVAGSVYFTHRATYNRDYNSFMMKSYQSNVAAAKAARAESRKYLPQLLDAYVGFRAAGK